MKNLFVQRLFALLFSIGIHAVFVLMLVVGMSASSKSIEPPVPLAIQATVVDKQSILDARQRKQDQIRDEAIKRRQQQQAEAEQRRQQQEAERQRIAKLEKQEADRQARIDAEQQKARERQQQLEDLQRRKKEAQQRAEQERQRLAELEEERRKAEELRLAKLEQERLQQLVDLETQDREREVAQGLRQQWRGLIKQIVEQNWRRPPTAKPGLRCIVYVNLLPGGEVVNASIAGNCNGDESVRRSMIEAFDRASPLPYKGYERVFERRIEFAFNYEG